MIKPRVAVVLLSWNGKKFLKTCLDSVFTQTYNNFYVIYVDNNSNDGSEAFIRKNYSTKIKSGKLKIVLNKENYGYAEGNNIGIRAALSDTITKYVAVINNDTEADKNWLGSLVKMAEKDKKIGSIASKILLFSKRDIIDSCGIKIYDDCLASGRMSGEIDPNQKNQEDIFGAYGAAAFYRRKMLEDISMENDFFDSDYFIYQEEFDLSWRSILRGWKCVFCPDAVMYHVGGGAQLSKKAKYLLERNRISTIVKNLQPGIISYCLPRIILYEFMSICINSFFPNHVKWYRFAGIRGKIDGIKILEQTLRKRKYIQNRVTIDPIIMKNIMEKRSYTKSFMRNS